MSQIYLEDILLELDKDSKLVYMIRVLVKNRKIDKGILYSIDLLIRQEIQKIKTNSEKSKLQKGLDYLEYLRQEEEREKSDIDEELENQLYDL